MQDTQVVTNALASANASIWEEISQLQKIVSIAPNILYVFNLQTFKNDFVNASLGASMGYSVLEIAEMGAEFLPRVCHPEDLPKLGKYFEEFHQIRDGEVSQSEYRMKHRDGRWRWMLSNDRVFERDSDGKVLRLIGVATDITALKSAQRRAMAEKRAADAANEELRGFSYSVSHDMKSPTNTLKLLLTELQDQNRDQLDEDGQELVDLSLEMVSKLQALVEDILGYTRVIGSEVVHEGVALAPMLASIQQSLAADIKAADAQLIVDDLPNVRGNPVQLRVYLQNLIGNAIKYRSPDRPLVIHVQHAEVPNTSQVSISVRDTGIGIAPENQDRIFGMFKRLHLESEIPGTGLGLALCRRVALNHGSDIKVRSALEEGATFTMDLPRW